ncbi:hypothetical protein EJ08DRAFT_385684 [Tothia fuscella]|uniref:Uncharacterized protein n=1 Tax=Tothia fuscella TaxID=1048955 RepID=A0A9P4P180_9PEZI|nr:hypothetical protein EJ08DRAFT_385684 [Tothia fuscella]
MFCRVAGPQAPQAPYIQTAGTKAAQPESEDNGTPQNTPREEYMLGSDPYDPGSARYSSPEAFRRDIIAALNQEEVTPNSPFFREELQDFLNKQLFSRSLVDTSDELVSEFLKKSAVRDEESDIREVVEKEIGFKAVWELVNLIKTPERLTDFVRCLITQTVALKFHHHLSSWTLTQKVGELSNLLDNPVIKEEEEEETHDQINMAESSNAQHSHIHGYNAESVRTNTGRIVSNRYQAYSRIAPYDPSPSPSPSPPPRPIPSQASVPAPFRRYKNISFVPGGGATHPRTSAPQLAKGPASLPARPVNAYSCLPRRLQPTTPSLDLLWPGSNGFPQQEPLPHYVTDILRHLDYRIRDYGSKLSFN